MRLVAAVALLGLLLTAFPPARLNVLTAQCPDGAPPPCGHAATRAGPPAPAERARHFTVLPFRNLSRSPELDWLVDGSVTLLSDVMGRWRDVSVVSEERLLPAMRQAGVIAGSVAELPRLRRLAEATGGWTVVTGELLSTGGRISVRARAIDAVSGREVSRTSTDVPAGGDVRDAFGRIGTRLLLASGVEAENLDIGAITTRSLDAYRAYVRGVALFNRSQYRGARDEFRAALGYDSSFAQAWFSLSSALLFQAPDALFNPASELNRAIARAVALSDRLAPRQRDLVLANGAMFQGRFGAAREVLDRLVAADSGSSSAVGWLSFLEYVDPIVVQAPAGPRRRSSLERSIRLAASLLRQHPDDHGPFIPIVYGYLLAAGDLPGIQMGYAREAESIDQLIHGTPVALFVPLLRDTIESIPLDVFNRLSADSVAAARARARAATRTWVDRWLVAAPGNGAAHQAAARIAELEGDFAAALRQLVVAESIGVEFGYIDLNNQRIGVLVKAGRYDEAGVLADSLWRAGRFTRVTLGPTDQSDALRWIFNLFVMRGAFGRADSAVATFARVLGEIGLQGAAARGTALSVLSGRPVPPIWMRGLPARFRMDVLDSAHVRATSTAPDSTTRQALDALAGWVAADAASDSALAARARAAPWFRP